MCTYLTEKVSISGSGKGPSGWFRLTDASVYFDHPVHAQAEHTLNIDFLDPGAGPSARVAVELTAESARALAKAIQATLDAVLAGGTIPPRPPLLFFLGGPIPPDPPWEGLPAPHTPLGGAKPPVLRLPVAAEMSVPRANMHVRPPRRVAHADGGGRNADHRRTGRAG